jgi:hypothetical protein
MDKFIILFNTLTPIGIGICGLLGVGSIGKIILKNMEYKNNEKIRKEKRINIINSNLSFYRKLFDKLAVNIKSWNSEQIRLGIKEELDDSIKMSIADFDTILGGSIIDFNNENAYLDMEDQIALKQPLQARGIY